MRLRTLGLALVAVFAMSAVAASEASAFTTWDVGGVPVKAAETVKLKSVGLKLSSGGTTVECSGPSGTRKAEGTVEPAGKDKVNLIELSTATDCHVVTAGFCEKLEVVKAVNLSWSTNLSGSNDELFTGGTGSPGWAVTCKTLLGSKTVTCTKATTLLELTNGSGVVDEKFKAGEKATCSGGTSTEGTVEGTVVVENAAKTLSVA